MRTGAFLSRYRSEIVCYNTAMQKIQKQTSNGDSPQEVLR